MQSPIYPEIQMKQITRNGIVIDYCPKSGGVWLDKGELEKLIQMAQNEANSYDEQENVPFANTPSKNTPNQQHSQPHYPQPNYDHKHNKHPYTYKKKESVLSEIFDFDFF